MVLVIKKKKKPTCQFRRCQTHGFNPWFGKIAWRRAWQPTQCPCLENPMDRGGWRVTVQGVAQSRTRLSDLAHTDRHRTFLEPTKPQGIKCLLAVQHGFCALDIKKSTENKVSAYTQGKGIHFSAERRVESMAFEKTSR